MPRSIEAYKQDLLDKGVCEDDAYFMSHIVKDMRDLNGMFDEAEKKTTPVFQHVLGMLKQFLNAEGMYRKELSVDWEVNWSSKAKDTSSAKKENLVVLSAFYDLLMLYAHDVILKHSDGPQWYRSAVEAAYGKEEQCTKILQIALEEKDACNKYNDLNLLVYQTLYKLGGIR